MEQAKVDRINFLARKKKAEGLTAEELEEQKALRAEYLEAFKRSLTDTLDNVYIKNEDGSETKLKMKE